MNRVLMPSEVEYDQENGSEVAATRTERTDTGGGEWAVVWTSARQHQFWLSPEALMSPVALGMMEGYIPTFHEHKNKDRQWQYTHHFR